MKATAPVLVIRQEGEAFLFLESQMGTPVNKTVHLRHKIGQDKNVIPVMQVAAKWCEEMGFEEPAWYPEDESSIVAGLTPMDESVPGVAPQPRDTGQSEKKGIDDPDGEEG